VHLLGVSIVVLVLPDCSTSPRNYKPFFTHGAGGFAASLPLVFFAYAGFESLAQTAGEVRDSTQRLPRHFSARILATTVIYFLMSGGGVSACCRARNCAVRGADGRGGIALSADRRGVVREPRRGHGAHDLGHATMLVPSRVGIMLAEDGLAPAFIGRISKKTARRSSA